MFEQHNQRTGIATTSALPRRSECLPTPTPINRAKKIDLPEAMNIRISQVCQLKTEGLKEMITKLMPTGNGCYVDKNKYK